MTEQNNAAPRVRKRKSPWVGRALWGVAILGVIGVGVVASLPKPVDVEVAQVKSEQFIVTVDEDGMARVTDRYVISAPLAGNLARIELKPGDEAKQGDVIARLLPAKAPLLDARARVEGEAHVAAAMAGVQQAEAQAERAKVARDYADQEATRTQKLAERGTLSQQELDRALMDQRSRAAELASSSFAGKVARHELQMARAALGRLDGKDGDRNQFEVTSPVHGRVLKVLRESEGVVQAGAQLLEVGDPHALEIAVDVLTTDAVHIRPGAPVSVEEWGRGKLAGVVRRLEPSAFTRLSALGVEEQRVNIVVDLKSPYDEWKELGDGYRVEARIETYRKDGALTVPWSALFRKETGWAVFVIEQGRAKRRPVEVGQRNDRVAEIIQGLRAGERVVVHPSDKVQDGVQTRAAP